MLTCNNCEKCWDIKSPNWKECFCGKKDIMVMRDDKACEDIEEKLSPYEEDYKDLPF